MLLAEIYSDIDQLNADLSDGKKNTLGDPIDIRAYDSEDNQFTCPCDGYMFIMSGYTGSSSNAVDVFGNGINFGTCKRISSDNAGYMTIYVRKGMKIHFVFYSDKSYYIARFIPFQ